MAPFSAFPGVNQPVGQVSSIKMEKQEASCYHRVQSKTASLVHIPSAKAQRGEGEEGHPQRPPGGVAAWQVRDAGAGGGHGPSISS
jgi:hypothetical protein